MALKPFPLTTNPEDENSPESAFPVTLFGLDEILSRLAAIEGRLDALEGGV